MKVSRDPGGRELATALESLGCSVTRQAGSHLRLIAKRGGAHHVTIPAGKPLRIDTLLAILKDVASHHDLGVDELIRSLDR